MGIRETLNRKRHLAIVVVLVLLIVVTIGWMFWQSADLGNRLSTPKAFYTVDDGATWFKDDGDKIPPYDYKGKQAVSCFVYKCGDKGEPWVSHLMRYTAEGKRQREAQIKNKGGINVIGSDSLLRPQLEVKEAKSGDQGWIHVSDPRAAAIQKLQCPDGSMTDIKPVDPNE
jgi:hypothetical protein